MLCVLGICVGSYCQVSYARLPYCSLEMLMHVCRVEPDSGMLESSEPLSEFILIVQKEPS